MKKLCRPGIPISVPMLTYNEEKNIGGCLESICDWADDIFIVDSFSTDRTLEIAKRYTDKICQRPFENYALQWNWAQGNLPIKNEWLLHLDADERVSPELREELEDIFSRPIDDVDGFLIQRKIIFMGRPINHGVQHPVYHLRIFRKSLGRCEDRIYDQHFYVKGRVKILKGAIINVLPADLAGWIRSHNRWSSMEAVEFARGKEGHSAKGKRHIIKGNRRGDPIERRRWLMARYYSLPVLVRPFLYFMYRYFLRLGFLDGEEGMIYHFLQGFWYRFLVDAKIYENERQRDA